MSHRTRHLPARKGAAGVVRELRYHEASRQGIGIVLILVYALTARPAPPWLLVTGLAIALVGVAVRLYASGYIAKNEELATDGPYAYVRHPLYTGNILVLIGFSLANGWWWALPLAAAFFWFYYPCAIEYEDRKLRRLFGARWDEWAARVPALIPTAGGVATRGGGGTWSLARSSRRNGELVVAAYCLACMLVLAWPAL